MPQRHQQQVLRLAGSTFTAMEEKWITDRPPTEADADRDGDVRMKGHPGACGTRGASLYCCVHWSHVAHGAPWQHTSDWKPAQGALARIAGIATSEHDRIARLEKKVHELDSTIARLMDSNFRLTVDS